MIIVTKTKTVVNDDLLIDDDTFTKNNITDKYLVVVDVYNVIFTIRTNRPINVV